MGFPKRGWVRFVVGCAVLAGALLAASSVALAAQTSAQPESPPTAQQISVTPSTTVRGSGVDVNVISPPLEAATIAVELDGRKLPFPVFDSKLPGTLHVVIPDSADPASPDFVPLGSHQLTVRYDDRWFAGGAVLTIVRPEQTIPVLRHALPIEIKQHQADRKLVLSGANFLTNPPADNEITVDGLPLTVVWDGCDDPQKWAPADRMVTHGKVDRAGTSITLCNFPLAGTISPGIAVRQGTQSSESVTLHAPPLSKGAVVASSALINLLAVALVAFLAHFVRPYSIDNEKYGTFRILFLDPESNTYSLSKYQFYMWTGAALFAYAYLAFSRVFVQQAQLPDVPRALSAMIGIGAGTAIGSQVITGIRGPKGSGEEKPNLGDFVTSGGVAAADRVQMFVWTTFGVFAFCLATFRAAPWEIQGLPQIGQGLMYLMGLSSLGYLGGKLARKPGPVLNEISISLRGSADGAGAWLSSPASDPARQSSGSQEASDPPRVDTTLSARGAPVLCVIDLRGRNLSLSASFEIEHTELPFRMLTPVDGVRAPRLVAPEGNGPAPTMAKEMQLFVAPDTLGQADRANYDAWFATAKRTLRLSITNPDGQRAEISFSVPPGASQAQG